ncbi:MAG: serine hydrolase domain-containing protein [Anaerolineae bacterium]
MNAIEQIGLSPEQRAGLERAMAHYVDDGKVAGLVTLLARPTGEPYLKAYGLRHRASGDPMQVDTLMRIASLTKPITATAVMMLVEEGKLSLSDPVVRFIPSFGNLKVDANGETKKLSRSMTIWHLLTHTSGLVYGIFDDTPVASQYRRRGLRRKRREEIVATLADLPLAFQPGARWHYSISYDVLGYIIDLVTDRSFEDFLQERIFRPLGMSDTGFVVPELLAHRLAAFYTAPNDDGYDLIDDPDESPYLDRERPRSAGGGLISTAPDYLRFMRMILNDGQLEGTGLLSADVIRQMISNQLPEDMIPLRMGARTMDGVGYGYGFGVKVNGRQVSGQPPEGTFWWAGVTGAYAWGDPVEQLIGIVMLQSARYYEPAQTLRSHLYRALEEA